MRRSYVAIRDASGSWGARAAMPSPRSFSAHPQPSIVLSPRTPATRSDALRVNVPSSPTAAHSRLQVRCGGCTPRGNERDEATCPSPPLSTDRCVHLRTLGNALDAACCRSEPLVEAPAKSDSTESRVEATSTSSGAWAESPLGTHRIIDVAAALGCVSESISDVRTQSTVGSPRRDVRGNGGHVAVVAPPEGSQKPLSPTAVVVTGRAMLCAPGGLLGSPMKEGASEIGSAVGEGAEPSITFNGRAQT